MYQKVMDEFQETDLARRKKIAEDRARQFMTESGEGAQVAAQPTPTTKIDGMEVYT